MLRMWVLWGMFIQGCHEQSCIMQFSDDLPVEVNITCTSLSIVLCAFKQVPVFF